MQRAKILVADSSETSRKQLCQLLNSRGHQTFQATDGAHALRLARTLKPDLVIVDTHLFGLPAAEVGAIIENDQLSTILYMTGRVTEEVLAMVEKRRVYAYLTRPILPEPTLQIVDMAIVNARKMAHLTDRVHHLEQTLEGRKTVDQAKGLLMEQKGISEREAYQTLRRRAMDRGMTMEKAARQLLDAFSFD